MTAQISGNIKYVYTYNYNGDVTEIKAYNGDTLLASQTFSFNKAVNTGGNYQGLTYDLDYLNDDLVGISYNGSEKLSYAYDENGCLSGKTFANNQSVAYDYLTNIGLLTSMRYKVGSTLSADEYKYSYETNELKSMQKLTGNYVKIKYTFDQSSDNTQNTLEISGDMYYNVSATSEYDLDRNALLNTQIKFMRDGSVIKTFTENNTYNNKNELTQTVFGNGKVMYTYDGLGRVNNKSIVGTNNRAIYGRDIVYKTYTADGETYTTNLVSAVENAYFNDDPVVYHYDDAGRITMQGTSTTSETYNYDDLNRLSGMTISGMSYSYAYDSKNNLLTETTTNRYNTVLDTKNYTYNAYGQLTSVANSGSTDYFRYDELGNMTMYKGGTASGTDNLSWCEGNKLASGAFNENEFSYEYDPNGHRYKKIVNDKVTEYYLDGSRVIAENRIDDNVFIYYYYDQSGIIGMNYNGSDYYFGKNILGDITEIYNSSGTVVGSYEYDPWGLVKTITGEMAEKNPFRYRGYYFDTETGFYYLQTRYYDPSIRRFISADNYELIPKLSQTLGQLNMYAYCNNNLILFTDPSGEMVLFLIILLTFTIAGGMFGYYVGKNRGSTGGELISDILIGAVLGLAAGGIANILVGAGIGLLYGNIVVAGMAVKNMVALGAAVYNIVGAIAGPILGVKFEMFEWGNSKNYDNIDTSPSIDTSIYSYYCIGKNTV